MIYSYDALNVTIYYGKNLTFAVANVSIPGFLLAPVYVQRNEIVNAVGVPWEAGRTVDSNGATVFEVEIETNYRYEKGQRIKVERIKVERVKVEGCSYPLLSIEQFYVPALDKTSNHTSNTTIFFDLELNSYYPGTYTNPTTYYDALNVTIYYGQNLNLPIGNVSIPGFRQGRNKRTHRKETVTAVGVPWETARTEVSKGTAVFLVDLKTMVRYKLTFTKSKRYMLMLRGNVTVNDQGSMTKRNKKGVELSSVFVQVSNFAHVGGFVGFVLLFLWF
ncbi:hypothetical protein IFM89_007301 [Coptis chinensis]|uniref:Uncharacterized protein n=1 Tax=Coptis chinensis TaxID=261450 RepID=A0A835GX06_9MAGN|nr:hypothetical protein IFM89_007301 [Coptis chinensis]